MNKFISQLLSMDFVNCIYSFCTDKKYELWVIVNKYNPKICKKIYMNSIDINDIDILIIDANQIDYDDMPESDIIYKRTIAI